MATAANSPGTLQSGLFRAYFLLLQRIDQFGWIIWTPAFNSRWLSFIRIPAFRAAVLILASGHMKRVIHGLDRACLLRLAIDGSEQEDWKALHERSDSMKAGLPTVVLSRWLLAICAFVLVFSSSRVLPQADLPLTSKLIASAVTLNPEKLAELAGEPGAPRAIAGLLFWVVALFILVIPIIVYHFRFKRLLFNFPMAIQITRSAIWNRNSRPLRAFTPWRVKYLARLDVPRCEKSRSI